MPENSQQRIPGRLRNAWQGFRSRREQAAQTPTGSFTASPAVPAYIEAPAHEPTEEEKGRGAYEPYVSLPMRLAAAWSWRFLIVLAAIGVAYWLLSKISVILLPALIALLITALISPFSNFLVRHGWKRGAAAGVTFIGFIVLVLGLLTLVGQQIVVGMGELTGQVVAGIRSIADWLQHNPFGIDSSRISVAIDDTLNKGVAMLEERSGQILGGVAGAAMSVGSFFTGLILTLFTAFFFLYDGRRIFSWFIGMLPRRARGRAEGAGLRGWQSLVQYVRVQVIVAGVDAIGIGIGAFFIGIPLVFPLTVLVFLGSFVPIVGAVVTGIIAVIVALVSKGLVAAIIMTLVVLAVQQLEGNVLQPFIMGKAVSVHPLAVVLAVAAGATLYGIVGALFAVPVIAVLNTIVLYLAGEDVYAKDGKAKQEHQPDDEDGTTSPQLEHDEEDSPLAPDVAEGDPTETAESTGQAKSTGQASGSTASGAGNERRTDD